jgi:hypothetical protein
MRVVCLLSGEHPSLPAAELGCAVRVEEKTAVTLELAIDN